MFKNKNQITLFHKASAEGQMETIKSFLEKGIDIDTKNQWSETPLHTASQRDQPLVMRFLIKKG